MYPFSFSALTATPLLTALILILLATPSTAISGVDDVCVSACSDWSVVMGHCRGTYNDYSQQASIGYTNEFLACLCLGSTAQGQLGNATIGESAGTCLGCKTTPGKIKEDLEMFLNLCAVQAANGTATNATLFMPISYTTSEDSSMSGQEVDSGATALALAGFAPRVFVVGVGAVVMLALGTL